MKVLKVPEIEQKVIIEDFIIKYHNYLIEFIMIYYYANSYLYIAKNILEVFLVLIIWITMVFEWFLVWFMRYFFV